MLSVYCMMVTWYIDDTHYHGTYHLSCFSFLNRHWGVFYCHVGSQKWSGTLKHCCYPGKKVSYIVVTWLEQEYQEAERTQVHSQRERAHNVWCRINCQSTQNSAEQTRYWDQTRRWQDKNNMMHKSSTAQDQRLWGTKTCLFICYFSFLYLLYIFSGSIIYSNIVDSSRILFLTIGQSHNSNTLIPPCLIYTLIS